MAAASSKECQLRPSNYIPEKQTTISDLCLPQEEQWPIADEHCSDVQNKPRDDFGVAEEGGPLAPVDEAMILTATQLIGIFQSLCVGCSWMFTTSTFQAKNQNGYGEERVRRTMRLSFNRFP